MKYHNEINQPTNQRLAALQTKIPRLQRIITLAEDPARVGSTLPWPTVPTARALQAEYLADQPEPDAKPIRSLAEIELMIEVIIAVAEKITPTPADTAVLSVLLWISDPALDWTAACEAAAHLLTAINQPPPPTP